MDEDLRPEQMTEILREFNAEIADADGEGMDEVYNKYAPILRTMPQREIAYHKHLLALKHGRERIKDPDLRELWTLGRKILFAVRTMSARG